jgi:hypothetical protein
MRLRTLWSATVLLSGLCALMAMAQAQVSTTYQLRFREAHCQPDDRVRTIGSFQEPQEVR